MPELNDVRFKRVKISGFRLRKLKLYIDSINAKGSPLSVEGKGILTFPDKVDFKLDCFLEEAYFQSLSPTVQDGMTRNKDSIPTFFCEINGDFQHQSIYINQVISRVVKTKIQRFGRKLKSLFQ